MGHQRGHLCNRMVLPSREPTKISSNWRKREEEFPFSLVGYVSSLQNTVKFSKSYFFVILSKLCLFFGFDFKGWPLGSCPIVGGHLFDFVQFSVITYIYRNSKYLKILFGKEMLWVTPKKRGVLCQNLLTSWGPLFFRAAVRMPWSKKHNMIWAEGRWKKPTYEPAFFRNIKGLKGLDVRKCLNICIDL